MTRFLTALLFASTCVYGNAVVVNNPSTLGSSNVYSWSQLGGSQSPVGSTFIWWPAANQNIDGALANGPGTIVQPCAACAWKPNASFASGDSLLFTGSYAANSSSLTLSIAPAYGLGNSLSGEFASAGPSGTPFSISIPRLTKE